MNRYINTERLGVIATDSIVTQELGWIFREQPIADVGLDAIIEQVEEREPLGKFLAIQIKTGLGNFYKNDKTLTHYVSNIHYNYWLNLTIPIILIAHIPEWNSTYWIEINKSSFKKTKKKWKIDIPLNQEFNINAKKRLTNIFSFGQIGKSYLNFQYDTNKGLFYEATEHIRLSTESIGRLSEIMTKLKDVTKNQRLKIQGFTELKLHPKDSRVITSIKVYAQHLNVCSSMLEKEIHTFSEMYFKGIALLEQDLIQVLPHEGLISKSIYLSSLRNIADNISMTKITLQGLRLNLAGLDLETIPFREAKKQQMEVIDLIIFEQNSAREITENLIHTINLY